MKQIGILWIIIGVLIMILTLNSKDNIKNLQQEAKKVFNHSVVEQLTIAQAILESNLDNKPSQLALKYNNLFGIKWPSQLDTIKQAKKYGKPVELSTFEYIKGRKINVKAKFIFFNSIEDCLEYRKYMLSWNRYKKVYETTSLKEAATEMQKGGYATDPKYINSLVSRYNNTIN